MNRNIIREVYEDNHLLAINKPAGWLVQGDKTGDPALIDLAKEHLKEKYQKPGNVYLGLCHRLDRPVSGVLLLAKTSKVLPRLNKLFLQHRIQKKYLAITDRAPKLRLGIVQHFLLKDRSVNKVTIVKEDKKGAKEATTAYRILDETQGLYLWELAPTTGRSHQLRVALQSLGCPIIGDLKYGGAHLDKKSIALHCQSLSFVHPVKRKDLQISASVPSKHHWDLFSHVYK